jgi:hypothetical protein
VGAGETVPEIVMCVPATPLYDVESVWTVTVVLAAKENNGTANTSKTASIATPAIILV